MKIEYSIIEGHDIWVGKAIFRRAINGNKIEPYSTVNAYESALLYVDLVHPKLIDPCATTRCLFVQQKRRRRIGPAIMVVHVKGDKRYGDVEVLSKEFLEAQDGVEELASKLRTSMTQLHALQDEFEKSVKKQTKTLRNLEKSIAATRKTRKPNPNASTSNSDSTSDGAAAASSSTTTEIANGRHGSSSEDTNAHEEVDPVKRAAELRERLTSAQLQRMMPSSGGFFVGLFLGALNVRFMRKSERLQFKTDYEKMKLKLAPGLVVLALICLAFENNRWVHMVLQMCLSLYYVTLAIRENILRVNGSNIKSWWIIHHYFTMMQCVLLLTWPDNESYARFRKSLHLFGLYNAVLQIFQTRYQMARLYALRSLGMASEMDVASSDSTQIHWSRGMAVLYPMILFGQAMQAFEAGNLMLIYMDSRQELQILMLSLLFAANFFGNFYTTCVVLNEKRKRGRGRAQRVELEDEKKQA